MLIGRLVVEQSDRAPNVFTSYRVLATITVWGIETQSESAINKQLSGDSNVIQEGLSPIQKDFNVFRHSERDILSSSGDRGVICWSRIRHEH